MTANADDSASSGTSRSLYAELTALENLELFGRLYRVPERRERSGMLLERFGLWEARAERVSTFSRGMTQRLALCRALLHDPALLVLDEPFTALDEARCRAARPRARRPSQASARSCSRRMTRDASRRSPPTGWRWREPLVLHRNRGAEMSGLTLYASDVVALARKDLRLELRARDTLPAMLLFVVATLAVFHFALPTGSGDDAAYGMLWIAIVFTALLGLSRAWAPERDGGALDGLVLAPCDRSAIWLGKTLAVLVFLAAAEVVALPAFALFFAPIDARRDRRRRAREHRHLRRRLAARGDGGREPWARGDPAAPLPPARDPARRRRRRRRHLARTERRSCPSSASTTSSSRYLPGPRSNMSSRNNITLLAVAAAALIGLAIVLALLVAPEDANQGVSQRIFYFHVPIALTAYTCFGLGAWKALRLLWVGGERRDLESYSWIHQGTIFGALTLDHRLDLGEGIVGRVVGLALEPARPLPRPLPLLLRLLHAPLLARGGRAS